MKPGMRSPTPSSH